MGAVEKSTVFEVYRTDSGGHRNSESWYVREEPRNPGPFIDYSSVPVIRVNGQTYLLRQPGPITVS